MTFHRSKPTDFERLLERQRREFPTHYDDHDAAVDQLLANKPEFRVNADGDGSGIPTIPKEVMDKLLAMDINKSYFTRPSSDEIQAFLGLDGEGESTDAYAFYLPFHHYPRHWGVYIYLHGIHGIRRGFQQLFQAYNINDPEEQITIANDYLYFHELYHHKTESFGLRVEAILGLPFYLAIKRPRYSELMSLGRHGPQDPQGNPLQWCYEETCAESFARESVLTMKHFKGSHRQKGVSKNARDLINDYLRGCPSSYREAAKTDRDWDGEDATPKPKFPLVAVRSRMYEDYMNRSYDHQNGIIESRWPVEQRTQEGWSCAWGFGSKFDEPIGIQEIKSHRTFYLERN